MCTTAFPIEAITMISSPAPRSIGPLCSNCSPISRRGGSTRLPRRCAYIDAAGIAEDRKGWLFRTAPWHNADALTDRAMNQ
jgi:hypothetical protein